MLEQCKKRPVSKKPLLRATSKKRTGLCVETNSAFSGPTFSTQGDHAIIDTGIKPNGVGTLRILFESEQESNENKARIIGYKFESNNEMEEINSDETMDLQEARIVVEFIEKLEKRRKLVFMIPLLVITILFVLVLVAVGFYFYLMWSNL